MDILMIGHSGSGKTTFMAGLYTRMKMGVDGFTINSNYNEYVNAQFRQHNYSFSYSEFLTQEKGLDKISDDLMKGIYPGPTMIRQEYYFNLVSSGHGVPFNWYDYRGGVLMERGSNSSDADDLTRRIKNSDALVVFLDGDTLVQSLNKNARQYKRVIACVNNAIANVHRAEGEYFPISFVITKGDLHEENTLFGSEGFDYFKQNLFDPMSENNNVMGMLTVTEINRNNILNVHFPLMFSVLHGLKNYAQKVYEDYLSSRRNEGFFESIGEFFTNSKWNAFQRTIEALSCNFDTLSETITENNKQSLILF